METLRFKQLPHFRCGASVPWFLLLTSYFSIFPLRSNRFSLREFAARQMLRSRRLSEFRRDPIISPLILFPGTEVPGYFLFVAMRRRAPPDLSDSLQPDIRRRLFLPEVKQPLCVDCSGAQTWTRKPGKPLLECWRCARSICRLPRCTEKMSVIHGLPPDLTRRFKGQIFSLSGLMRNIRVQPQPCTHAL